MAGEAVAQLLERWQGGVLVASHDRALLERVDRIVELTPIGISIFGGAWSAFAEARDAARARAEADLDRASDALRNTERALQKAREKKARRDKAGRAWRAKGIEDKMFMDREKERAENSAARESQLADRLIGDRTEALRNGPRASRDPDAAVDRSAANTSARRPRTDRVQGRGDGLRRAPSVRTAVI